VTHVTHRDAFSHRGVCFEKKGHVGKCVTVRHNPQGASHPRRCRPQRRDRVPRPKRQRDAAAPVSAPRQADADAAHRRRHFAENRALHPGTMDERVGGWGRLLALFRLVHAGHDAWITARGGKLSIRTPSPSWGPTTAASRAWPRKCCRSRPTKHPGWRIPLIALSILRG
jgi:hypothetical protein